MRILVVTGSSGGHVFPALAFLESLKERQGIDSLLILPKTSIIDKVEGFDYRVRYLSISPVKISLDFKNIIAILRFFKAALESLLILSEFKPDTVVGFGSISSVPLVLAARAMGIKVLIHEQNVLPGRANRLLAKFAQRIGISFNETREHLSGCEKKLVLTGNPLRRSMGRIEKQKALDFFGLAQDKFTVLVAGGSQSSRRINSVFMGALYRMPQSQRPQVIHISGQKDYEFLSAGYKSIGVAARVFIFCNFMHYAYSASDLTVSRAGATTIAEVIFFSLPAILIPYPYAYKHQLENARVLEKQHAAMIINDDVLNEDILGKALLQLIDNPEQIKQMRLAYARLFKTDANSLFLESVLSLN